MALPLFQTNIRELSMMQSNWGAQLNPVLSNPITNGLVLTGVNLSVGANVVNHKLSRKLQGWIIIGINAASTIYDTQASNQSPQLTLNLNSSANCIVNLYVF